MPYILINKLKALMQKDFASQRDTEQPFLGKTPTQLDDALLDEIDVIIDTAKQLFGQRVQPTSQQARVMEENGFSIEYRPPSLSNSMRAVIVTPKGLIAYH